MHSEWITSFAGLRSVLVKIKERHDIFSCAWCGGGLGVGEHRSMGICQNDAFETYFIKATNCGKGTISNILSRIGLLDADHTFLNGGWELVLFSENLVAAPYWKEILHSA